MNLEKKEEFANMLKASWPVIDTDELWSFIEQLVREERVRIKNAILSVAETESLDPDSAGVVYLDSLYEAIGGYDDIYDELRLNAPNQVKQPQAQLVDSELNVKPEDLPF